MKVILFSVKKWDRMSGVGRVLSNLFPLLQKKINIKWKNCSGTFILKINIHPFVKLLFIDILTSLKLLFDKDIWKCEIINAHRIDTWLPTIWICKILRKKSLITFHETYEYTKEKWFCGGGKWAQWLWNYTIKNADYIIDISNTIKRSGVFYISDGINLNRFRSRKIEKDKKVVLFVGRLTHQKGVEYFVEASQIVKKELKVKFIAVTNSPLKKVKEYVNLLRKNEIELYEKVPSDEIVKLYQKADVLILPSLSEAFGLVLLEAMACGTPVVASNVGGIPNVVKDGIVGFLIPPKDSQAIAKKTLMILKNEEIREKMRINCLEWVKNFSWEKIAEKYIEIYRKILSR